MDRISRSSFLSGIETVPEEIGDGPNFVRVKDEAEQLLHYVSTCFQLSIIPVTHIPKVLNDQCYCFVFHDAHQDQEHGLVQQGAHGDALSTVSFIGTCATISTTHIGKPFLEDIQPIPNPDLLLDDLLILAVFPQHYALLLFSCICRTRLADSLPAREGALEPMLPVIVDWRGQDDHDEELAEEDAVEDEGLGLVPCLEPLGDDVGA